jgi:hypothetical protein
MWPDVYEQVKALEVDVFRIGLVLILFHPLRLGGSTDHGRRFGVSATKAGWESCNDVRGHWRNLVRNHDRPACPYRQSGRKEGREVHGFLEGAAAMCSGGESKQVCDRSRSKDRNPESTHVLM